MVTLRGRVVEYYTGAPVAGVLVAVNGYTTTTDYGGLFQLNVQPKVYTVKLLHKDFSEVRTTVNLISVQSADIGTVRMMSVVKALR